MEQAFPAGDASVVDANEALALTARNAGRTLEARDALDRALRLGDAPPMRLRAADRLRLLRTQALLELDLGHLAQARARFESLLLQPPGPEEQRELLRLLSNTLAAQGDAAAALEAARRAAALASGPPDLTTVLTAQAQAVAQSLQGDAASAAQGMRDVIARLQASGSAPDGDLLLRAHRLLGEAQARAGELEAARRELEATARALRQAIAGHPGAAVLELELGQVLDQLGCVAREAGDPAGARALHAQAAPLLKKILPADHPLVRRNALYQDIAAWRAQAPAASRDSVARSMSRYLAAFPERSVWRDALERATSGTPCTGTAPGCVLIL